MDDISSCADDDDDPGPLVDSSEDEAELVYGFPARDVDGTDDEADDFADTTSPINMFMEFCQLLLLLRTLTAKDYCILMYLAGKMGIAAARKHGLKPGSPSGHFNRKVEKVLGFYTDTDMYVVSMPGRTSKAVTRTVTSCPTFIPHELVEDECKDNDVFFDTLEVMVDNMDLPPAYYSHPVVLASTGPVCPLAIFIDAVPYSHTDSIVGWWVVNLVTNKRHLFCTLRKKACCKCGCRGWCTFHVIFTFLRWSLEACAKKKYPCERHDGMPWTADDIANARDTLGDSEMSCFLIVCCMLKAIGQSTQVLWASRRGTMG